MWLLKLHLAFSILCFLTYFGGRMILWDKKVEEKLSSGLNIKQKKSWFKRCVDAIKTIIGCFVPIINVILVISMFACSVNPDWVIEKAKERMDTDEATQNDDE